MKIKLLFLKFEFSYLIIEFYIDYLFAFFFPISLEINY